MTDIGENKSLNFAGLMPGASHLKRQDPNFQNESVRLIGRKRNHTLDTETQPTMPTVSELNAGFTGAAHSELELGFGYNLYENCLKQIARGLNFTN